MKKILLLLALAASQLTAQTLFNVQRNQLLTSGRVPFVTTNGIVSDTAALTFNSGTGALGATTFVGAFSGSLASGTGLPITGISATGTPSATTFLRGDGSWQTPAGSGDMTLAGVQTVTGAKTFGSAGAVGKLIVAGNTSGTTILNAAAIAGSTTVTLPNANSTLPIYTQQITYAGPSTARTVTYPDASFTVARTDAANTFTGIQTMTSPVATTSIDTGSTSFTAFAGATTLMTIGGTGASASSFFPSTLDATSSTTGAIRTSGGISAAKAANFGTTLNVAGISGLGLASSSTTNLNLAVGTTGVSSLRIGHGAAPTSPVNGDVWSTTAGLFFRANGVTQGPLAAAGGITVADTQVLFADGANTPAGDAGMTYNKTTDALSVAGPINAGTGASTAGAIALTQGTTQSTGTTNITIQAPAAVTSYIITEAGTVGTNGAFITQTTSGSTATRVNTKVVPTGTVVGTSDTQTLTNKNVQPRITAITSSATPAYDVDASDVVNITALAAAITSMTSSRTGTPYDFQQLEFRIKDNGTARAITWGADFASGIATLPTTTILGKTLYVYCEFDTVTGDYMAQSVGSYP